MERFPPHDCRACGTATSLYSSGGLGQHTVSRPLPRWSVQVAICAPIVHTLSLFTFSPYKIVSLSSLPVSTCRSYTIATSYIPYHCVRFRPTNRRYFVIIVARKHLPFMPCCYLRSRPRNSFIIIIPPHFVIYVIALQNSFVIIVASEHLPFIH